MFDTQTFSIYMELIMIKKRITLAPRAEPHKRNVMHIYSSYFMYINFHLDTLTTVV